METINNPGGSYVLGCDAVSYGEVFPTFERNAVPSSSWTHLPLAMKAQHFFVKSETIQPTVRRYIPKYLNPQLQL